MKLQLKDEVILGIDGGSIFEDVPHYPWKLPKQVVLVMYVNSDIERYEGVPIDRFLDLIFELLQNEKLAEMTKQELEDEIWKLEGM